jgi:hypothetical protein
VTGRDDGHGGDAPDRERGTTDRPPTARSLLAAVRDRLADRAATATSPRVTVGERVVLVDVTVDGDGNGEDGGGGDGEGSGERLAGVAHRPPGEPPADGWPRSVRALADLADGGSHDRLLARAVGIATLNALSAPDVDWLPGDPMAALSDEVEVVATVGLFRPAFRKFSDVSVRVVERDPPDPATVDAPAGVTVSTTGPSGARRAFEGADVLFVTGSTLVYGGVDRYLAAAADAAVPATVLIGATASFLPEPAFEAGVDVLAGARVDDLAGVRERVVAGDCDTDLHDSGLTKGYVVAPRVAGDGDELDGLTLPGAGGTTSERRIADGRGQ